MPARFLRRVLGLFVIAASAGTAQEFRFNVLAGQPGVAGYTDSAGAARFNFTRAIALDGRGNLLIADVSNHAIRRLSLRTGAVQTIAGQPGELGFRDGLGTEARLNSPSGIAVDAEGNIFFSDPVHNCVRRITPAGQVETLPEVFSFPGKLAMDPQGDLLVCELDRVIRRRRDGSLSTVATGSGGGWTGLAVDPNGTLYVTDQTYHVIRRITSNGTSTVFAGEPMVFENVLFGPARIQVDTRGFTDGTGRSARFNWPAGITFDRDGSLLVADTANCCIRRITLDGIVTTIAGFPPFAGSFDGPARSAAFFQPWDLVVDRDGAIYIADTINYTVRKLADGRVTTIAGRAGTEGTADSEPGAVRLNRPFAITADRSGGFLFADADNGAIRRSDADGLVTTVLSGATASLRNPEGVALDAAGNVFISDRDNQAIRRLTPTGVLTTVAGALNQAGAVDGVGSAARFAAPRGLALDRQGNLYVADSLNHAIRKIAPNGLVTTFAGELGQRGRTDGAGAQAHFDQPQGVAVDENGNVFVADFANSAIRHITPAGVVTTLAGALRQPASVDGPIASARFINPHAIALDGRGDLWVIDAFASVRRISRDGVVRTLFGPLPPGSGSLLSAIAIDGLGRVAIADAGQHTLLLGVAEPSGTAQLSNLSVRGSAGTGADALIAGFNLGGGGAKPLLVRAVGPTLAAFGLTDALADPALRLDGAGGARVAENDDWRGEATLTAAAAAVGAFPLPATSRDAVLLAALPPGSYTAQVGRGATAGATAPPRVALLEVYDTGGDSAARLTNLSVRTRAAGGADPLTAGFTLAGDGTRRVLIRALGPALTQFGVAGTAPDPGLKLFRGNELLAQNDDWSLPLSATARSELGAAAARTGAFPLAAGSADAALLVTLPAGGYTVQVDPGTAAGVVLVEVYEVP